MSVRNRAARALEALTEMFAYADTAARAWRNAERTGDLSALEQHFGYAGPVRPAR
jgi:hypothetical protein